MEPEAQAAIDAALAAHFDGAGAGGDSTPASAPAETTPAQPNQDTGTIAEADSPFSLGNPADLPPEVLPYYKSLQANATKLHQQWAEEKARYQALNTAGIQPDEALQAYEFYNRLNTDPDYAAEIVNTLAPQLQAMGKWQYQGAQETAAPAQVDDGDAYSDDSAAVTKELAAFRSELESMRQQAEAQQYLAEMSRQQALVQQQHPNYQDRDFKAVYALSHSTGGDLIQANALYQGIVAGAIAEYAAQKAAVPTVTAPVTNTVTPDDSVQPKTLDEAHEWVTKHVLPGLAANS